MTSAPPPFSEPVRLNQIGLGIERTLAPDEAARARIAAMLDLIALPRFAADISLKPSAGGWTLSGRVRAHAVQRCGLTLEPLPGDIDESFQIALVQSDPHETAEVEVSLDEDAPDVVEEGVVDIGVYAVEQLALALDPFPRKEGAVFEPPATSAEISPFAVLKTLKTAAKDGS